MFYDTLAELDRELGRLDSMVPGLTARLWRAPVDVRRESDRFVAELDLPGVDPSSIDVTFEDGWLSVRAERSGSREAKDEDWVVRERSHEAVVRRFSVGETVDVDAVTAAFEDGVLTLSLPVVEDAKPRKIALSDASTARELGAGAGTSATADQGKAETAHSVTS